MEEHRKQRHGAKFLSLFPISEPLLEGPLTAALCHFLGVRTKEEVEEICVRIEKFENIVSKDPTAENGVFC